MVPTHDYDHVLIEIRKRLHDPRGSKAVVMIGAGFSRNAVPVTSTGQKFPLWPEMTEGLARQLYPDKADADNVLRTAGATSSALRLAEEFEVAFGRSRLIDFVRETIRDDEFLPGRLHYDLLELRWADVFTTNYDRLLEDAARSLWKRHYDPVYCVGDIPLARRPRLIKLHGSLPDLEHLVLTESDYRSYHRKYGPFVAAVRAALTENILCLIGFSGVDPNFLAWTGWLRDELQGSVPKTYLFTSEEMKPFQRQLLEDRHIIPVPITKIAGKESYAEAYAWLIDKLGQPAEEPSPAWNMKPHYAVARSDPT